MKQLFIGVGIGFFLFANGNYHEAGTATFTQARPPNASGSGVILGEIVREKTFEKSLGGSLTLEVQLLGKAEDSQIGIYVSIVNKNNPKDYQFVLLPDLVDGQESNFIGTFAVTGRDPKIVSKQLRSALESVKEEGLKLTYFTENLSRSRLALIQESNIVRGQYGVSAEEYAKARAILDPLKKTTGLFKVLDYRLGEDPTRPGVPLMNSLKFSFEPRIN